MGIGRRIKEAREALHLTQKELGDKVGVTASAITNYENETSHPKEPIMYKLINELEIDANFLFQDSVDIKKSPSPAEAEEGDLFDDVAIHPMAAKRVQRALIALGLIGEDDDLTNDEAIIVASVFRVLTITFRDKIKKRERESDILSTEEKTG